jgi:hypothetical protein
VQNVTKNLLSSVRIHSQQFIVLDTQLMARRAVHGSLPGYTPRCSRYLIKVTICRMNEMNENEEQKMGQDDTEISAQKQEEETQE